MRLDDVPRNIPPANQRNEPYGDTRGIIAVLDSAAACVLVAIIATVFIYALAHFLEP